MSFKFKIFFMGLFIALLMGGATLLMFSGAWQDLAKSYALSTLDLRLQNFENKAQSISGEWAFEVNTSTTPHLIRWLSKPQLLKKGLENRFAADVIASLQKTKLAGGVFELEVSSENGEILDQLVSFQRVNKNNQSAYQVVGLDATASLMRLSPWAAPFLGIFLAVLAVAMGIGFYISHKLNLAYDSIETALGKIGTGDLENIEFPDSKDPSIKKLSLALKNTVQVLNDKDEKITSASKLANVDSMTGCSNFRAFEDFMGGLVAGTIKPEEVPVLGIMDLDHFKSVNDTYGHQVGDFVLKETAQMIRECIRMESRNNQRPRDFFARYGGEEFVIVFTSVKIDSVVVAARRILNKIKSKKLLVPASISSTGQEFELSISASIGIAVGKKGAMDKDEWIKEADLALYDAKHTGRGKIVQLKPERQEWTE